MAPKSYPCTCSSGHAAVSIADQNAWQSHIASEHSKSTAAQITALENQLAYAAAAGPAGLPVVQLQSAYAKYGISRANLQSRTGGLLSRGNLFMDDDVPKFLDSFASGRSPSINDPNFGLFMQDFLVMILTTAASEELTEAGRFFIFSKSGPDQAEVNWTEFFSAGVKYFANKRIPFKPRKVMRSYESLLEQLYFDAQITDLQDFIKEGTAISKRLIGKNGQPVPPWVAVPELFNHLLTDEYQEARRAAMAYVEKRPTDRVVNNLAFDPDSLGAQNLADAEETAMERQVDMAMTKARIRNAARTLKRERKAQKVLSQQSTPPHTP